MKPMPGSSAAARRMPNPAKNAPMRRTIARALDHQAPQDQRTRDIPKRREHVEGRKNPDPKRDPDNRDEHQHAQDRPHDADERTPSDCGPEPASRRDGGIRRAGSRSTNRKPKTATDTVIAIHR